MKSVVSSDQPTNNNVKHFGLELESVDMMEQIGMEWNWNGMLVFV